MRLAAARRGHREGGELRDLGVRGPGHRARAGLGRFRRVHAGLLGDGPAAAGEGRDPGEAGVRHEAGTGHRAGETPDGGRDPRPVGRRRRGVRPVRGVPGRAAGRCRWPTSSSSPATTGSPSRKTRSSALTRQ